MVHLTNLTNLRVVIVTETQTVLSETFSFPANSHTFSKRRASWKKCPTKVVATRAQARKTRRLLISGSLLSHDLVRSYRMVAEPPFMCRCSTLAKEMIFLHAPGFAAIQVQRIMRGVLKVAPFLCMYTSLSLIRSFLVSFWPLPSLAFYPWPQLCRLCPTKVVAAKTSN